jgi:sec-independent protein translocase protein TatA
MFGSLGPSELIIILLIVLVIFGASRLPRLGRGLGEGIRNFKEGLKSDEEPAKVPPATEDQDDSNKS